MLVHQMPGCVGCPLRGDGSQPFVPDELRENAPVLVVGQNPGETEAEQGRPFVGKTGLAMERTYLKSAALLRGDISIANALRCRWQDSNDLPPLVDPKQADKGKRGIAEEALDHCSRAHGRIPTGTRLVVTQGEYALWSVTGARSVSLWRGWLLPLKGHGNGWRSTVWTPQRGDLPVLATVHIAALMRDTSMLYPTRMDWAKVPRILRREWPQPLPKFGDRPPTIWPSVAAFDTEFFREDMVGTVWDGPWRCGRTGLVRYSLYDGRSGTVVEAPDAKVVEVPSDATVVMHNIEADMAYLTAMLRGGSVAAEDTMLMHAVLWSDLPHDLEYLASLYGRHNRHKHLFHTNPLAYSMGDSLDTWDVYQALAKQMKADPQSFWVYRNCVFPLTGMIMEAERVGLALDQGRVRQSIDHFEAEAGEAEAEAQAYTGYPINLGSPEQVSRWLYQVEKVGKKQRKKHAGGQREGTP